MTLKEILKSVLIVLTVAVGISLATVFIVRVLKAHRKPKPSPKAEPAKEENKDGEATTPTPEQENLEEMKELFKQNMEKEKSNQQPIIVRNNNRDFSNFKFRRTNRADKTDENSDIPATSEITKGSLEDELTQEDEHTKYKLDIDHEAQGSAVDKSQLTSAVKHMSPETKMLLLTDILKPKFKE